MTDWTCLCLVPRVCSRAFVLLIVHWVLADGLVLGRSKAGPSPPDSREVHAAESGLPLRRCREYGRSCLEYAVNSSDEVLMKALANMTGTPGQPVSSSATSVSATAVVGTNATARNLQKVYGNLSGYRRRVETEVYRGEVNASKNGPRLNLCINGRLVPRFFLLGAQKAATTNFFNRIMDVGTDYVAAVNTADPTWFWKEPHVFDWDERFYGLGRGGWLQYYPECSSKKHTIGVDATPSYISSPVTPGRIIQWYGPLLAPRLEFLVILREPLSRMHSSFYHGKQWAFQGLTFDAYINRALANTRLGCASGRMFASSTTVAGCQNPDDMPLGDPYHLSLYVPQLYRWLTAYQPRQFVICPMMAWVAPGPGVPSLVEYITSRLGGGIKLGMSTSAHPKQTPSAGRVGSQNPDLETDLQSLSVGVWESLKAVMNLHASPSAIGKLLAPHMSTGLSVFGYTTQLGQPPQVAEHGIAQWIGSNW
eukprot:TRINITY_DN15524_c0_g1_i1.p1 TRINITY_DN15524_c0_g1~~TRINITY_DN15524_c0_g1_i1.p1  ORF type:complete len:479 (+),score=62.60 TRINITY_DN15524_c0_g1_i1:77-1513(+)